MKPPRPRGLWVGRIVLCGVGVVVVASACKDKVTDAVTDPTVGPDSLVVASIEMLPAERALSFVGMSDRMAARRVAGDGTLMGGSGTSGLFSWSSNAPDVVTVDSLGNVTAVREGTARITATSAGVTGTATVTVREAVRLAWSFPFDGSVDGRLTIAEDGTLYVKAQRALHAMAPGGQQHWSVETGGGGNQSAPAIAPNGTLYIGTYAASLMAVDRSGAVRWSLANLDRITTSPALGSDGTVYVASLDGTLRANTLYAVGPAGQRKWEFSPGSRLSSPALAGDGTILVGAYDGRLHAVNPDGAERWIFQAADTIWSSPVIGADGTIYFGSADHLYALTPSGALKWRFPVGQEGVPCCRTVQSPAIGSDGTVYVSGYGGLHAVDPSGRLRWRYVGTNPRSGTQAFGTPVVAGDGTIYVGGGSGRRNVFALAPDGTVKWEYPTIGGTASTPAIGLDGTIFTTSSRTLYAIVGLNSSNGGYANAPWPTERGNRANTGRAGGR